MPEGRFGNDRSEGDPFGLSNDFQELKRSVERAFDTINSQLKEFGTVYIRADVYKAERAARDAELRNIDRNIDNLERTIFERLDKGEARQRSNFLLALTNVIFPVVMFLVFWILTKVIGS